MSKIDYQALRETADAANKASWGRWESYHPHEGERGHEVKVGVKAIAQLCLKVDAEFIAASNPATVLALLDELEAAEKRIAEQQSAIIAPGIMRCAGCGFVLTKNSINMAAGTITAGDSKTEPCPNGCGPLWPVTWKEQALQMRDDSEQWFIELQQAKNRIAELEARTVKLPEYRNSPDMHTKQFYEAIGFNQGLDVFIEALRAAGIGVKGE